MKKGFTLIELLAVIIILAIIALIATPVVLKVVDNAKESGRKSSVAGYADAVKLAINEKMFENNGSVPAIDSTFLNSLTYQGETVTCNEVKNSNNYGVVLKECIVGNNTNLYCFASGKIYSCDDENYLTIYEASLNKYKDNSGANKPVLYNNMIPVYYDGTNWIYADIHNKWYDYDSKEWANAAVLNSDVTKKVGDTIDVSTEVAQMYVWIPRYKYTIFNGNNGSVAAQEINVIFESGTNSTGTVSCTDAVAGSGTSSETCIDTTNGSVTNGTSTYTHPAFTFGTTSLTGFWVGKFEVSGTTTQITIKPNVISLRNQSASSFLTSIKGIATKYSVNADSHMMKNMEWGAVAYLEASQYGLGAIDIGTNNNSNYITGCGAASGTGSSSSSNAYDTVNGKLASTTGNIYGVYDMSGGAYEYLMGNMVDSGGSFYISSSEFLVAPNSKYYDSYTYSTSDITHSRGKLGDATKEVLLTYGSSTGAWYSDCASFPSSSHPWFKRGGYSGFLSYAGVFNFDYGFGNASASSSSRVVLAGAD